MSLCDSDNSEKLIKVATEILQTETTYVEKLKIINYDFHDFFVKKSKSFQEKNYPTVKQIESLFLNLGPIMGFHQILLAELQDALNNWSKEQKIGGIFKKMAPFIKLYATYISGYEVTQDTLQAYIRKFPKFAADLEAQQKLPQCHSLTLMHHMLEPIQRVPRYRMLLQEYKKFLPPNHADFQDLSLSLEMVMKSADHANNSIHEYEASLKLNEIQNRIVSNIVIIVPGRRIIHEGELGRCSGSNNSKQKSCYVFLFNDIFLDCSYVTNKKMKQHAFYQNGDTVVTNAHSKNGFSFDLRNEDITVTYACKSEEERDLWVSKIQQGIDEFILRQNSFKHPGKKSNTNQYSEGVKKISEFFGSSVETSKKRSSLGHQISTDSKGTLVFPLCDGLLDVAFERNAPPNTFFCVLTMQRKLIMYTNETDQIVVKESNVEGYSLYEEKSKDGPVYHLTNDDSISFYLSTKDKKSMSKWLSMLRRSGVIVSN